MKNVKGVIGCVLILCGFLGMLACIIASCVFSWQNPDMTAMRRFLEYPQPSVWCIVDYIGIQVGIWMVRKS
jgi:hypothetical protein